MPTIQKDSDFGRKLGAELRREFLLMFDGRAKLSTDVSEAAVYTALVRAHDGDPKYGPLVRLIRRVQSESFWMEVVTDAKSHPVAIREIGESYLRESKQEARIDFGKLCANEASAGNVAFFLRLAKAVEITIQERAANSNQSHIAEAYQRARRTKKRLPTVREVAEQVKRLHPAHEQQDERTVRWLCKELGLPCAVGRRGRPKG